MRAHGASRATVTPKIFDSAQMNTNDSLLNLLIPLLLFPALSSAAESVKQRDPIDIPLQPVAKMVETQERTPWGKARARTAYGFDEKQSTVHFSRFSFASPRALEAKKLGDVIENFKNNYKCTAKKSNRTFSFAPSCKVSAQLVWEGLCASGERYVNVQFIAHGRLYEVGATRLMKQSEHNLARTVEELTGRCQGINNEKNP